MASVQHADKIVNRAAVLDAVAAALDQIDRHVAFDRQQRDRRHDALLRENERLAAQVESLQREQAKLKEQLARAQEARPPEETTGAAEKKGRPRHARQPLGELSANAATPRRPAAGKEKPHQGPPAARSSTPIRAGTKQQIMQLLEKAKKNEKRWMRYAEVLEDQLGSKVGSGAVIRRHRPAVDVLPSVESVRQHLRASSPGTSRQPSETRSDAAVSASDAGVSPEPGTADDETDDAEDVELPLITERDAPSDAGKAVVKQEPSSDGPVFVSERTVKKRKLPGNDTVGSAPTRKVKIEDDSSDPVVERAVRLSPQESMDLDGDAALEMPTPKKLRSLPPAHGSAMAAHDAADVHHDEFVPSQGVPFWLKPLGELLNDSSAAKNKPKHVVLTPPGRQRAKVTGTSRCTLHRDESTQQLPLTLSLKPSPPATSPTKAPRALHNYAPKGSTMAEFGARTSNLGLRRPEKAGPVRGPLRDLDPTSLRLNDFRPNPKATGGVFHAYNDVVRGKAERASLAGCTDPNCAGGKDWKAMAATELRAGGPSLFGTPDSINLMERFLGDDAHTLGRMTRPEKEAVWLDARTWDSANKYGRCRHRFPRAPTPEQYWDTDFPSTQDRARDKAEGERVERAMVEQRYREAMRKGGRWLFRDE